MSKTPGIQSQGRGYLLAMVMIDASTAVAAPILDTLWFRYQISNADIPLQCGAALIAVITFVGVWLIQRSRTAVEPASEMRDAISASVIVVYLVILCWSTFFPRLNPSNHTTLNPLTSTFITNFTAVTGIVIGFYFTSVTATQIAAHRQQARSGVEAGHEDTQTRTVA